MPPKRVLSGLPILFFSVFMLAGCGDVGVKTYPVSGKVLFSDDAPVTFGRVEFHHPGHDLTAHGTIQEDGSFRLSTYSDNDGAPAGTHDVVVTQLLMSGQAGITPHDHGRHVDSSFSKYETSGIRLTVDASGDNEFRIVVEPE